MKNDFLQLMGKGKRCWKYVRSPEDFLHLKEFEDLYLKSLCASEKDVVVIEEILHFVWLGPKEYPETSRKYLQGWIEKHPDWKVVFWSDRNHLFLPPCVELRIVTPDFLGTYLEMYQSSANYGEKSDIVRLLALNELGGVYVDHDMECRTSFATLHRTYPFYGGLLTPGNPVIKQSAIMRNSIIGAKKGHPILKNALELAKERWSAIEELYPGNDVASTKKRVTLRVFAAFHDSVLSAIKDPNFEGIIFPAGYFNEIERDFGIFAKEDMVGAWYTDEMSHHEQYLKDRLHRMMKRMHMLFGILAFLIVLLFSAVVLLWMRGR